MFYARPMAYKRFEWLPFEKLKLNFKTLCISPSDFRGNNFTAVDARVLT